MKKYITLVLCMLVAMPSLFAQAFKAGDKAEALINNSWQEVTVLRLVSGKTDLYQVQAITATGKTTSVIATHTVREQDLRSLKTAVVVTVPVAVPVTPPAVLGVYNIYAGIQKIYIGHFELIDAVNYKVALSSDEESYATGTYTYDAAANSIEWKTGFFWQKKWSGKIVNGRIQFSNTTYGDKK